MTSLIRNLSSYSTTVLMLSIMTCPAYGEINCIGHSEEKQAQLIELFTSEGCSSCPPADRYISGIKPDMTKVILAYHVDYWNYLGWEDPFSDARYTQRQKFTAAFGQQNSLYTPMIVVNGRVASPDQLGRTIPINQKLSSDANITSSQTVMGNVINLKTSVQIKPNASANNALFIAIYENNLESHVYAGENSGSTLHHDYVVRQFLGPFAIPPTGKMLTENNLTIPANWKIKDIGIATFVQNIRTGDVLQALSQPYCKG